MQGGKQRTPEVPANYIDLYGCTADEIFKALVKKGNRGVEVRSTAAPAMATEFVKSTKPVKAQANQEGAFAEIVYPSEKEIADRQIRKHGHDELFGYKTTRATDSFPGGFGERSAKALVREESTYQLKGTFPSAALSYTKLRARIEARGGDIDAIDTAFAKLWGLTPDLVRAIPKLFLDGSEATRMSAMEDRAYHALACHPGHNGGYRIDMATLSPDSLGTNIPLNWPRIRTALKAIAMYQLQGDLYTSGVIRQLQFVHDFRFRMDLVESSQPVYIRPTQWETVINDVLSSDYDIIPQLPKLVEDGEVTYGYTNFGSRMANIKEAHRISIHRGVLDLAAVVTHMSNMAVEKTIKIIIDQDRDRAMIREVEDEAHEDLECSTLATSFSVPKYRVTRSSLYGGLMAEKLGADNLPDIVSHGPSRTILDMAEFRSAGINMPVSIAGALNMTAYIVAHMAVHRTYVYMLMSLVPDPRDNPKLKSSARLRRSHLYADPRVRALGQHLLGDSFIATFGLLLGNMASDEYLHERNIKATIWEYLSGRCGKSSKCPVPGSWRDLIIALREMDESWTLYYWIRVSIGRQHHSASGGILAPIHAGESSDLLSVIKKGVLARAKYWAAYYSSEYRLIEGSLSSAREKRVARELEPDPPDSGSAKYIPPHLRRTVDLEHEYNADEILKRTSSYTEDQYCRMVEMQSKSKFFADVEVTTQGLRISVGISDAKMRERLIEFYQARWYSLHKRIERAKSRGTVFKLGKWELPVHPWGDLIQEFPDTPDEMLRLMSGLDGRAWTISPTYLQDKFRKSISELWDDIDAEITQVVTYIEEVEGDIATEQDEIIEQRLEMDVKAQLAGTEVIVIPVPGYTNPQQGARTETTVYRGDTPYSVPTSQNAHIGLAVEYESEGTDSDDGGLPDGDSFAANSLFELVDLIKHPDVLPTDETEYATYRSIWHVLGMPDRSDDMMRLSFGVAYNVDMDSPMDDTSVGPLIMRGHEATIASSWSQKLKMMKHRCGIVAEGELEVDM